MREFSKLIMRARKFPKWMRDTGVKEKIIRKLAEEGLSNKHIALLTGLSESRIRQITKGIKGREENLVKNLVELANNLIYLEEEKKKLLERAAKIALKNIVLENILERSRRPY